MNATRSDLLDGVKVLDLSTFSPVRFGTTVLADLGADVIQVDRPASAFREDIPLLTSVEHPRWVWHSRNKRSLGLDIRQPGAAEVLRELVADVDVVMEGFAVGVAARLGLDFGTLCEVNPALVYAAVTGFGQRGPNAKLAGHEMTYQAAGGVTAAMAAAGAGRPAILPAPLSDSVASMYAVIGVLAALRRRDRTGQGAYLDISIQDSVLSMFGYPAQYLWREGITDSASIDEFGGSPASSPYLAADGHVVMIGAVEPGVWRHFCDCVDRPDLVDVLEDRSRYKWLRSQLSTIMASRTREEWKCLAEDRGAAVIGVLSLAEVLSSDHIVARGMVAESPHPTLGSVHQVMTPINVDGQIAGSDRFAVPGSDTVDVLAGMGIAADRIDRLRADGAVFTAATD